MIHYNVIYLFTFYTRTENIYLTSSNKSIDINHKNYQTYSSLNIKNLFFDHSGNNKIIIEGVYHKNGINNNTEWEDTKVKIDIYSPKEHKTKPYLEYFFSKIETLDNFYFKLHLISITKRLEKKLLHKYSKTCRASFGDEKCKIDINQYKQVAKILKIKHNIITVENIINPELYKKDGYCMFNTKIKKYKILNCTETIIELQNNIDNLISCQNTITLHVDCNKELTTCCKKFNNAINFRGEPFIFTKNI